MPPEQSVFSAVASESAVPLAAEPIFHIGPLVITNSMLFGVIIAITVLTVFITAARRSTLRPHSKFAFSVESLVDMIRGIAEDNFPTKAAARKHMPFLLTLFTFILLSNLSGLIPGVGTIVTNTPEGQVPLLRAFTTDLNATLALAVLTIGSVQFYAIKELGILGHLKHYFTNKPWNPVNLFIGLIEVMGEFIRIMTLSMRLFGVIYAGEVLIHVFGELGGNLGWAATVPVYLLEIFFCSIQAYIFMMLTTVYLANAITHQDETHADDKKDHPRTADLTPSAAGDART